ncbi:MAG: ABC transporter permease [Propionibacteriaceae bacterium]|jgi:ABC-2 type transport system permease protein|nr:ABC transporter permease [Propionibacteriaceae bacterium]
MRSTNIRTVISFELIRTIRTRLFWITTFLGPLLLAVVIGISMASSTSAAETMQGAGNTSFPFEWVDHSGLVNEALAEQAGGVKITDPAQGIANVLAGRTEAFFEYPADPTKDPILITAQDLGIIGSEQYPAVASAILRLSVTAEIGDPDLVQLASGLIGTQLTTYRDGVATNGIWGMIPPLILAIIFFFVIVMQGNRMLTAVLEEKENRVSEMILTTIKPTALLTGKVVAISLIGLIQILGITALMALVPPILGLAGSNLNLDLSRLVFEPLPLLLGGAMLIGGVLLFTCSCVAIGAAVPTVKDAQGLFTVVLLTLVAPIYVVMWMLTNPDALLVHVFTFFPWTAPLTAMARNAMGTLPWWQAVIVIIILFATAYATFRLAARLFQHGSVEYAKKIDVRTVLKTH